MDLLPWAMAFSALSIMLSGFSLTLWAKDRKASRPHTTITNGIQYHRGLNKKGARRGH